MVSSYNKYSFDNSGRDREAINFAPIQSQEESFPNPSNKETYEREASHSSSSLQYSSSCSHRHSSSLSIPTIKRQLEQTAQQLSNDQKNKSPRNCCNIICTYLKSSVLNIFIRNTSKKNRHLHIACSKGDVKIDKALPSKSEEVNKKDDEGNTLLHFACSTGNAELVELLLKNSVDVNVKNLNNDTPLLLACKVNAIKIVEILRKRRARVCVENNQHISPLILAKYNRKLFNVLYNLNYDELGYSSSSSEEELQYLTRKNEQPPVSALKRESTIKTEKKDVKFAETRNTFRDP